VNVDSYRATANRLIRNPDDPESLIDQFANISEKKENGHFNYYLARRAFNIDPLEINTAFNYGSACHRTGRFKEALRLYKTCLEMCDFRPEWEEWRQKVTHHVGIAYRAVGDNKKAIEYYTKAYELGPNPQILKDRALAYLGDGQLNKGLQEFEVRREVALMKFRANKGELITQQKLPAGVVHWQGEDLTGKTVVVYHEEGAGDFIMVSRFIPRLRERGVARILLTGPLPDLLEMVSDNIGTDGIVPLKGPFECDYVVGSMTLPWRCGVDLKDVSGKPYFKAEAAQLPKRGKLNVGLVWRGNAAYLADTQRSMPFTEYCPLFDLPGVAFHSLQVGPEGLEVTNAGFDGFVANLEPFMPNWRGTAKVIQALDVVVSVDTSVAHMAGAMGKPVFTLVTTNSDWRWDRNSSRSIWYDSMRVIRQKKQDDWSTCIEDVKSRLMGMCDERRQAA
jgi:hypothetical protein